MSDKKRTGSGQGDTTTQPSITTDEAAQTDVVEGSPVGDEVTTVGEEPVAPSTVDEPEPDA